MGLLRTGFLKEMLQLLFFDHSYYGDSNETFFFFLQKLNKQPLIMIMKFGGLDLHENEA